MDEKELRELQLRNEKAKEELKKQQELNEQRKQSGFYGFGRR